MRIDENVSWDSFLRPLSSGLWVVMATCALTLALGLKICVKFDFDHRKEQMMGTRLQDLVFATFGAVFCLQGKLNYTLV